MTSTGRDRDVPLVYTPGESSVLMLCVGAVTPTGKANKASPLEENSDLNLRHTQMNGTNVTVRTTREITTHNAPSIRVKKIKTNTHTHTFECLHLLGERVGAQSLGCPVPLAKHGPFRALQ
jgi:hypothetical protein